MFFGFSESLSLACFKEHDLIRGDEPIDLVIQDVVGCLDISGEVVSLAKALQRVERHSTAFALVHAIVVSVLDATIFPVTYLT